MTLATRRIFFVPVSALTNVRAPSFLPGKGCLLVTHWPWLSGTQPTIVKGDKYQDFLTLVSTRD